MVYIRQQVMSVLEFYVLEVGRMARLVQSHRRATVAQTDAGYDRKVSEYSALQFAA